jgi:hypothetical protein
MLKQTSVEWLAEQLPLIQQEGLRDVIEQALAMEKEQIVDAAKIVLFNSTGQGDEAAEKYYQETYGGQDGC